MSNPQPPKISDDDNLDKITRQRLAQLAQRPVDIANLESRLEEHLPSIPSDKNSNSVLARIQNIRWTTLAAGLALTMTIGFVLLSGSTTRHAYANPVQLAEIHREILSDSNSRFAVNNVAQANDLLRQQAAGVVPLPDLPEAIASCCLREHAGTTLTCAVIQTNAYSVSITVADGEKLVPPKDHAMSQTHEGRFHMHTVDGINMVMAHENGKWMCVMGQSDWDVLLAIARDIDL